MAKLFLLYGLPFVSVTLSANGKSLFLARVLVDTGSGGSVFKADDLAEVDILPGDADIIRNISGIGGEEGVIEKQIASIEVGDLSLSPFTIQIGALDYGFEMDGIIGADFLLKTGAVIDFDAMEIGKKRK